MSLEIAVQYFVLVNMLQTQGQLDEPVQDLGLRETLIALLGLLYSSMEIATLTIVHYYTHVLLLDEAVVVAHHICMIQTFQN